jgi:hypothetical protein
VGHRHGGDPHRPVVEDGNRNLGGAVGPGRDGDVDGRTSTPASGMRVSSGMAFGWQA